MQTYDSDKNATEARQANPRRMNLRVLVMSLVGVVVVFGLIYLIWGAIQPA